MCSSYNSLLDTAISRYSNLTSRKPSRRKFSCVKIHEENTRRKYSQENICRKTFPRNITKKTIGIDLQRIVIQGNIQGKNSKETFSWERSLIVSLQSCLPAHNISLGRNYPLQRGALNSKLTVFKKPQLL